MNNFKPISFIENYDNEIIDIKQPKDVHEFFLNLLEKLEERLDNTNDADLIKYFFQGTYIEQLEFTNI